MVAALPFVLALSYLFGTVHCKDYDDDDYDEDEELHIYYDSPNDFVQIVEGKRGMFMVYPKDLIGCALVEYGEWEDETVEVLLSYVKPGDTVVEVGAHIGSMTVPLAKAVGPTGKVHAFEPQSCVFQLLNANVALNELFNVRTHQALVSEEAGYEAKFPLVRPDHLQNNGVNMFGLLGGYNFGAASFDKEGAFYQNGEALQSFETVQIVRLDDFQLTGVSLVKVDAAGHEINVLRGMVKLIENSHPAIMLEHNSASSKEQRNIVQEFLDSLSYVCAVTKHHVVRQEDWRGVGRETEELRHVLENYIEENILCHHGEKHDEL